MKLINTPAPPAERAGRNALQTQFGADKQTALTMRKESVNPKMNFNKAVLALGDSMAIFKKNGE